MLLSELNVFDRLGIVKLPISEKTVFILDVLPDSLRETFSFKAEIRGSGLQ